MTALYFGFILRQVYQMNMDYDIVIIMILILILFLSFATLKVTIDESYLKIKFGYGIFQKRFALAEIGTVKIVKNHWNYGWGIRVWLWPRRMLIYNISGFDAVEIETKDGKIYRIGTDEPQKLEQAILQSIK